MPIFMSLERIEVAPHGVTLRLPMSPGAYTTVSEDEATILRALPREWTEVPSGENPRQWRGPERNTMVVGAQITKGISEDSEGSDDE